MLQALEALVDFGQFGSFLVADLGYSDGSNGGRSPFDSPSIFRVRASSLKTILKISFG